MTAVRRALLFSLMLALLAPAHAAPEQAKGNMKRVGRMFTGSCATDTFRVVHQALARGLREQGWTEGENVAIEYGCAEGDLDRLPKIAATLVGRNVDVLVAVGPPAVRAARQATTTIPIVFMTRDPVADGFVTSLARPGGRLTGVSIEPTLEFYAKQLELLKQAVPTAARVGVLYRAYGGPETPLLKELPGAAEALGITLEFLEAAEPVEIERAFAVMARTHVEAAYVGPFPVYWSHREQIVQLALTHRLPVMYPAQDFVQVGGLMSYGPDFVHLSQRVGVFAGKILRGADPATLPVEQPAKFQLVVNLVTARAINLTVPSSVLVRADRIIE